MGPLEPFRRDPDHWLYRHSPDEWMRGALAELRRAEVALGLRDGAALVAGAKRSAGMALNAALIMVPRAEWGRSYVEHLQGVASDSEVPDEVRYGAALVRDAAPPRSGLVALRSRVGDERLLEAARNVMAHAYAVVYGSTGRGQRRHGAR